MFDSVGQSIGKGTIVGHFDNNLLLHAHRYVLRHCDELTDLRRYVIIVFTYFYKLDEIVLLFNFSTCCREFLNYEKGKKSPGATLNDADIDMLINKHFADWLEQKVH